MSVIIIKCSNCGGPLEFKAETQNWTCEYCLSEFTEQEVKDSIKNEQSYAEASITKESLVQRQEQDLEYAEKATGYMCESCGAELVTDDTTAATFCCFCQSPTIIKRRLEGEYRPEMVIPFKFTHDKAIEIFKEWAKKKPLLPRFFTTSSQVEKMTAVYVPFWLFDSHVSGEVKANGIKVRNYTRGNYKITEEKYYHVVRKGTAVFKAVPADGSKKMDDKLMHVLEPYDYSELKEFCISYLSGYLAEKYDMDQNDVYGRVTRIMRTNLSTLLQDTIKGYSRVKLNKIDGKFSNVKATYVLLPVWVITFNFKGASYQFAMNGQTGKIAGQLPLSTAKATSWFSLVAVFVFTLLLFGGKYIWF